MLHRREPKETIPSLTNFFLDALDEREFKYDLEQDPEMIKTVLPFFIENALGKDSKRFLSELDPEHFQRIIACLVLTLRQDKIALKNFPALDELVMKLEKAIKEMGLTPGQKPTPEQAKKLKDILDKTDVKKLKQSLAMLFAAALLILKEAKLYQPQPSQNNDGLQKDAEKLAAEALDEKRLADFAVMSVSLKNSNVTGLVGNFTGAPEAPVLSFIGNSLIPDVSANVGDDPLSGQRKLENPDGSFNGLELEELTGLGVAMETEANHLETTPHPIMPH